jgi:hypothetical protein
MTIYKKLQLLPECNSNLIIMPISMKIEEGKKMTLIHLIIYQYTNYTQ